MNEYTTSYTRISFSYPMNVRKFYVNWGHSVLSLFKIQFFSNIIYIIINLLHLL